MKIGEIIHPGRRSVGEDSFGSRVTDDGEITAPGAEPTVIRIGGKMVRKHDPRLLPDVLPLSSRKIKVNDRDAMLWKGMDVDGRMHVLWSYDTDAMSEDTDGYLQDPLDPEGDTDGPGRTGDQDDIGEGDVIPFKRPALSGDASNLGMAKAIASDLFWTQAGSHYTPEEEAEERELENRLAKLGYSAEWDLDDPDLNMVITHMQSGRQYRMGEDELISHGTDGGQDISESVDIGSIMRMADSAIRSMPAAAGAIGGIKLAARALSRIGAPLTILGSMITGIASAEPAQRPQVITKANSTVQQFLQAYDAAKTEEERCRIANDWYGVKPPNDVCNPKMGDAPVPTDADCEMVYMTRGPNKGKTIRQCPDPEIPMPPANESVDVWDKPNPVKKHKKLSPADKAAAKARAKRAGRKYPNMVDNIWAARR